MTSFFSINEAAHRYDKHRPRVHSQILKWLADSGIELNFNRSIDIACGTGHSTIPLTKISKETIGIDTSAEMLEKAAEKGLDTKKFSYENIHLLGKFDLISTCMAFHWFDENTAIESYKRASNKGAIWLIYNFYFGGHSTSNELNDWFYNSYLNEYPSPKRGAHFATICENDSSIERIGGKEGVIKINLTETGLVNYLTTQSNIEHAVIQGTSYEEIEENLTNQLVKFKFSNSFDYRYRYDIYRYERQSRNI